jgi:hypothetical protein
LSELTFADGIGAITVIGATVRLDLVTLAAGGDGHSGRPIPSVSQRLVMPIDGFLASAGRVAEAAENIRRMGTRTTGEHAPAGGQMAAPLNTAGEVSPVEAASNPTVSAPKRHFP